MSEMSKSEEVNVDQLSKTGAIDPVINLTTSEIYEGGHSPTDDTFRKQIRRDRSDAYRGVTVEQYIDMMNEAGIWRSLPEISTLVLGSTPGEKPGPVVEALTRKYAGQLGTR